MKLFILVENQKLRHSNARHLNFSRLETIKKFYVDVLITHGSKLCNYQQNFMELYWAFDRISCGTSLFHYQFDMLDNNYL